MEISLSVFQLEANLGLGYLVNQSTTWRVHLRVPQSSLLDVGTSTVRIIPIFIISSLAGKHAELQLVER